MKSKVFISKLNMNSSKEEIINYMLDNDIQAIINDFCPEPHIEYEISDIEVVWNDIKKAFLLHIEPQTHSNMYDSLLSIYDQTRWPFFSVSDLQYKGIFDREEANRLYAEGKIRIREGMAGKLIEIIIKKH